MENDMRKIKGKEIAESKTFTLMPRGWIADTLDEELFCIDTRSYIG